MNPYNQFTIDILKNLKYDRHFHPEMEILYLLEGQAEVRVQDKVWTMEKDDIIVVNSGVAHELGGSGKNVLCVVKYDYQVLTEVISQAGPLFVCNSCADSWQDYEEVRNVLKELIYEELIYSRKTQSYKYSLFYHLLDVLVEKYMIENLQMSPEEFDSDEKLQKVIHYIHKNYQEGISLSELAEEMFISTSTLSRFFKKQTGIYFAEYVSQIRMKYAVNEMLYSNKNITKIAMDCGFSNASSFNKVFRDTFDCSPTEYRTQLLKQLEEKEKKKEKEKEELRIELQDTIILAADSKDTEVIQLDINKATKYQKTWNKCINIGSFYQLTRANVQYHLLHLVDELGFTHARVWSIFSEKLMITDGKTLGAYNYDSMDTVFDFLVQNHIKPWIDFYKRPDTAVRSAGNNVWYEENALSFVSREAWETFFTDFVKHLVRRYGKEELKGWIFEIGADPFDDNNKPYYADPEYNYWNVYEHAFHLIKKLAPMAEIGGPNGISNGDVGAAEQFMLLCKEKECIPDFLSFGLFPYNPHESADGVPYARIPDEDYEFGEIVFLRNMMQKTGLDSCKLYIGEWNNSVSNRNFVNDSCFRGLYVCKKLAEIWDSVDTINLWTGSDWVSSYFDSYSLANGGSGLMTKDGIHKPVFYAMCFLNRLADYVVDRGDDYIITRSQTGSLDILCFNMNWYSVNYFLEPEGKSGPADLDQMFTKSKEHTIHLKLSNMKDNQEYMIKRRSISRKHGSVLDEWAAFHYEKNLERQDVKYLQDVCIPSLTMEHVTTKDGVLSLDIELEEQEFTYLHVFSVEE